MILNLSKFIGRIVRTAQVIDIFAVYAQSLFSYGPSLSQLGLCFIVLPFSSESVAGFFLSVNTSTNITKLRIPYPQTGTWYLSLRSLCATEHG